MLNGFGGAVELSRFVGDPDDSRWPDEPTADLVDHLGATWLPRVKQEHAVVRWLEHNQPDQVLASSLETSGVLAAEEGPQVHHGSFS